MGRPKIRPLGYTGWSCLGKLLVMHVRLFCAFFLREGGEKRQRYFLIYVFPMSTQAAQDDGKLGLVFIVLLVFISLVKT